MMKFIRRTIKRFIKRSIRKIIKNRKIIAFFLVFTLSFSLFSNYKQEEPKAEVITLTTGVIVACAMLAVSAGVIITNQDMIEDVGQRVWEGIKDSYSNAFTVDGERIKINTTQNLFNDIVDICSNLPTASTTFNKFKDYLSGTKTYYGSQSVAFIDMGFVGSSGVGTLKNNYTSTIRYAISYSGDTYKFYLEPEQTIDIVFDISLATKGYFSVGGTSFTLDSGYNYDSVSSKLSVLRIYIPSGTGSWTMNDLYNYDVVSIPYTEENSKNVSADIPVQYFPTYGGSISVPIDKPITDYSPSISAPITKPQDFVGVGTCDIVIESDTVSDNVGTGEDSLTGVGDSILNPTFSKTIDLSPLYMDLSTKFPFSIPFDIYNLFKDFEVAKKRPVVSYSLPEKYFGTNKMEVDFAFYDDIFPFTTILRYFLLIGFVYFLIIKTRNLIGG